MTRFSYAALLALALSAGTAHAGCDVDVRIDDVLGNRIELEMSRTEDAHYFFGLVEGVRLGVTIVEKGDGTLLVDAYEPDQGGVAGKVIQTQSIKFDSHRQARAQIIRDHKILDIACTYDRS